MNLSLENKVSRWLLQTKKIDNEKYTFNGVENAAKQRSYFDHNLIL